MITGDNTRNFDSDTNKVDPISGMQVEIPYVPASQRHSVRTAEETDTIVVVGQARQKKRKRTKAVVSTTDATGSEHAATEKPQNSQAKQDDDVETPFDFNAVPNILDDNPDTEDRKKKRQRKQAAKRGAFFISLCTVRLLTFPLLFSPSPLRVLIAQEEHITAISLLPLRRIVS